MTMEELRACRTAAARIERLTERIARLRSATELAQQNMQHVDGGIPEDKIAAQIAELEELENARMVQIAAVEARAQRVERELEALPAAQRLIMTLRYLDGLSWREVARKAHYSVDWCFTLHRKAALKIQKRKQ